MTSDSLWGRFRFYFFHAIPPVHCIVCKWRSLTLPMFLQAIVRWQSRRHFFHADGPRCRVGGRP